LRRFQRIKLFNGRNRQRRNLKTLAITAVQPLRRRVVLAAGEEASLTIIRFGAAPAGGYCGASVFVAEQVDEPADQHVWSWAEQQMPGNGGGEANDATLAHIAPL